MGGILLDSVLNSPHGLCQERYSLRIGSNIGTLFEILSKSVPILEIGRINNV
jgi:hypothetical protein